MISVRIFGFENVTNANISQGILFEQPDTYGERKTIVAEMQSEMGLPGSDLSGRPLQQLVATIRPRSQTMPI